MAAHLSTVTVLLYNTFSMQLSHDMGANHMTWEQIYQTCELNGNNKKDNNMPEDPQRKEGREGGREEGREGGREGGERKREGEREREGEGGKKREGGRRER